MNTNIENNRFLKEYYSRLVNVNSHKKNSTISNFKKNPFIQKLSFQYKILLPKNNNCSILDLGVGDAWFASICFKLNYQNIELADFNCKDRFKDIFNHFSSIKNVYDIETNIIDFFNKNNFENKFDFIHMSHVIEHIPKIELLDLLDVIFKSLKPNGTLMIRTPNLLGPVPFYYFYLTPGHEYGFIDSNLKNLLLVTNYSNIKFHNFKLKNLSLKQILGNFLRSIILLKNRFVFRLFEGKNLENYQPELIVTAQKYV